MPGPLPRLNPENEYYWKSGEDGQLRIQRCTSCGTLRHPQGPICRACRSTEFEYAPVSGRGILLGFTINYQPWLPSMTPPYVVCLVGLEEDPGIRLTTNLLTDDLDAIKVGMAVEVTFEHAEDVWLPQFRPVAGAALLELPEEEDYRRFVRPPVSSKRFEHDSVFTGVGYSQIGRRLLRDPLSLTVEASLAAIADAGLEPSDIDGLATYPGGGMGAESGMSEGGITALEEALRFKPTWHNGGGDTPGQAGSIVAAMLAVSAGLCRHVLCFRTVWETTAPLRGGMAGPADGRVSGGMEYRMTYGATSAANWIAMNASHYFARYGADREVLGRIAVNARTNAARNPRAIYTDPMTLDDYFDARMVTTPFGLFDCDVPLDGSVAVIVSAKDAAVGLPHKPVHIEAVGTQIVEPVSWDQGTITHEPQVLGQAAHLWTRTEVKPSEVDLALLYDGFTFNCLSWIESLGFCGIGEATDFIGDGSTIAPGGQLPLNVHGGQLSGGRTHGYGFIAEGIHQMRGEAGERQISDAKLAVVSTGGGVPSSAWLLRAD